MSAATSASPVAGANLTDAFLYGEALGGTGLTGALYLLNTTVPEGWARDSDAGRLKRANGDAVADDTDGGRPGDDLLA